MGRDKSVTRAAAHRAEEAKWKIEEASFGHALYLVAEELRARVEGDGPARRLLACRTEHPRRMPDSEPAPIGVQDILGHPFFRQILK